MPAFEIRDSIDVAVPPNALYELVSDITRTGEWSPVCRDCWWDDGHGPRTGAWFTGRNVTPQRTWETRSQIVAAEPGRCFAWEVNGGWARWGYALEPIDGGTRITETWTFTQTGIDGFRERYGDEADDQIAERAAAARLGIPHTLEAIKRIAESAASN